MDKKVKSLAIACMVLLLGLGFVSFGSSGSSDVASAQEPDPQMTSDSVVLSPGPDFNVTWDFHTVAGVNRTSPPLPPAATPSDPGFNFTAVEGDFVTGYDGIPNIWENGTGLNYTAQGWDFGALRWDSANEWFLSRGYVKVEITNNKGYDIVITDLIAVVTNGTYVGWYNIVTNQTWGNYTFQGVDAIDPLIDEADYTNHTSTAGIVSLEYPHPIHVLYDGEEWPDSRFMLRPNSTSAMVTGPVSLMWPDHGGDAAATGHVAPVILADGDTYWDYFGLTMYGSTNFTIPVWGTITLNLTYVTYTAPTPPYAAGIEIIEVVPSVNVGVMGLVDLPLVDGKYLAYNVWGLDPFGSPADTILQIKVKVRNNGSIPINFTVNIYYQDTWVGTPMYKELWDWNITHYTYGRGYNLASGDNATSVLDWDLSTVTLCAEHTVKANATLDAGTTYVTFGLVEQVMTPNVKVTVKGDADGGGSVNILDVGAVAWTMAIGGYNVLHDPDLGGAVNILDVGGVAWEMAIGSACP